MATRYFFPVELASEGNNAEDAWFKAVDGFAQDPGPTPENPRIEYDDPPFRVRLCLERCDEKRDTYENLDEIVLGHFVLQEEADARQAKIEDLAPGITSRTQDALGKSKDGIRHKLWLQVETWNEGKEEYESYDPHLLADFATLAAAKRMMDETVARVEATAAAGHQEDCPFTKPGDCGEWTVEPHPDTEGAFNIRESNAEEVRWVDDGYDISDEEGDRRGEIAEEHKKGNTRMIEQAPRMFGCLMEVSACLRDNKPIRPELVKEIDRSLARVVGQPEPKQIPEWIQILKQKTHQEASSKGELVVVMDGGLIQSIVSRNDPAELPKIVVVDYDTEGSDHPGLVRLKDGQEAVVGEFGVDRDDKFCREIQEVCESFDAAEPQNEQPVAVKKTRPKAPSPGM